MKKIIKWTLISTISTVVLLILVILMIKIFDNNVFNIHDDTHFDKDAAHTYKSNNINLFIYDKSLYELSLKYNDSDDKSIYDIFSNNSNVIKMESDDIVKKTITSFVYKNKTFDLSSVYFTSFGINFISNPNIKTYQTYELDQNKNDITFQKYNKSTKNLTMFNDYKMLGNDIKHQYVNSYKNSILLFPMQNTL